MRPARILSRGCVVLLSWLVPLLLVAPPAAASPRRVVSLNLCTDQLALALAAPGQLASVTWLARDPAVSAEWRRAEGVPVNHGLAEEVVALAPDLALAGRYTARMAVNLLRRIGVKVVDFGVPGSLDDVRAHIREAAEALDRREAGEAAVAQFDAGLPPTPPAGSPRPVAVVYQPNGATVGPGSLINAVLAAAGFDNLALRLGLDNYGRLPLDVLIAGRPDLLVVGELREGRSLAEAMTRHAALGQYWRDRAVLEMPQSLWICGGPFTAQAASRLAAWRTAQ